MGPPLLLDNTYKKRLGYSNRAVNLSNKTFNHSNRTAGLYFFQELYIAASVT